MKSGNLYKSTKVVSGKRIQPPTPKPTSFSNADFLRVANYGLYALKDEKNSYVNSNIQYDNKYPGTLTKGQIRYLTRLFRGVDNYLSQNTLLNPKNHRITRNIRHKTIRLAEWSKICQNHLARQGLPTKLIVACERLLTFISEYEQSFYLFDNFIEDINKIPNRPVDIQLRILVDRIITDYQQRNNTGKYPTHPFVMVALNKNRSGLPKIQLSARQYGNFKLWRTRGTYWWYVQP